MKRLALIFLMLVALVAWSQSGFRSVSDVSRFNYSVTTVTPPHSLTTNLMAFYKLDETSTPWADSSGNGYNLTDTATVQSEGGIVNTGMGNTGQTGKLTNNLSNVLIGVGDFSCSFWITGTNTACYPLILGKDIASGNYNIFCKYNSSATALRFYIGAALNKTFTVPNISNTTHIVFIWTHITTNLSVYTNGILSSSQSYSGQITRTETPMKILGNGGVTALGGWMDEVGFWSRGLTTNEIYQNLYTDKWRP